MAQRTLKQTEAATPVAAQDLAKLKDGGKSSATRPPFHGAATTSKKKVTSKSVVKSPTNGNGKLIKVSSKGKTMEGITNHALHEKTQSIHQEADENNT